MGTIIGKIPYIILAIFVIILIILGTDINKEIRHENREAFKPQKRPLFNHFIEMIYKQLKAEHLEVSKDFITDFISFCILGGVNPQKIHFKLGQFENYWTWASAHSTSVRDQQIAEPEKTVTRILEITHDISENYHFNIRREYAAYIRLKYMKHVPDIWWFANVFEKYE